MAKRVGVTTRDIAERLGVSISTVGRALSEDPRISDATRLRVVQVAAELGYVGNHAARLMRGAPSTVVGLMVPDVRNQFYSAAAHALTQSLSVHGYQVMLSATGDDRDNELAQLKGMAAAQVAGLILVPTPRIRGESVRLLGEMRHVQLLRKHRDLADRWFGIDDHAVLRGATEHLTSLGHTRIAYLGVRSDRSTSEKRLRGYLDALGAKHDPSLTIELPTASRDAARAAIGRLLEREDPPTAVVAASVRSTEGALEELAARRVDVPRELSVVGFGDQLGYSWWGPGLTTMALPVHEVATSCAMWLLDQLTGDDLGAPYMSSAAGHLLERGSTGPPSR